MTIIPCNTTALSLHNIPTLRLQLLDFIVLVEDELGNTI